MYAREVAYYAAASEATVSRLLSGDRKPSVDLMLRIRAVLGWSIEDQADALEDGTYAAKLKDNMEAVDVAIDTKSQAVWCVRRAGPSRWRMPTLEPGNNEGATVKPHTK